MEYSVAEKIKSEDDAVLVVGYEDLSSLHDSISRRLGDITVTIPGGAGYSRRVVTSTITASVSDKILGVSGSSAIDIRLPSAADYQDGQYFTVKDEGGGAKLNNITIRPSGSQTIDGLASIALESPYSAINIYSDGISKFFIY